MTDVTIDRFRARYRIPAGADDVRRRLDGMLDRAFESALETGLELAGVGADELVCVRELHVPFRADLSGTEGALAGQWAEAFGRVLRRVVRERSGGAVRYRSPSAALMDVVRRAAREDFGAAWAWSSLGLWSAGEAPTASGAARGVADALASCPELAPAVLEASAADAVAVRFLLERLDAGAWQRLAAAALSAAGLPRGAASEAGDGPGETRPGERGAASDGRDTPAPPEDEDAFREGGARDGAEGPPPWVADAGPRSALARRARRLGVAPGAASAVAALALLARAPGRLRSAPDPARVVEEVARRLGAPGGDAPPAPPDRPEPRRRGSEARSRDPRSGADAHSRDAAPDGVGRAAKPEEESAPPSAEAEEAEARPSRDGRDEARTAHGGLPFLLHLLDDETRGELLDEPALAGRPLPWILHRLAVRLAGAEGDDSAVLAFCGLGPEAAPPTAEEEPETDDEADLLDRRAGRLRARLRERLDAGDRSPGAVTREVVRRPAAVAADPGWIEVRLSLRDVSPEIRRTGLDLDPDFLPWLGVVMRFSYV